MSDSPMLGSMQHRAPPKSPGRRLRDDTKNWDRRPAAHRNRAVVLSTVLASALLLALGLVYLFTRSTSPAVSLSLRVGKQQFIEPRAKRRMPQKQDTSTRYLAYLSHSGYHNQRIALENALTLAKLLNRTLLLPPVRFGPAVPYIGFDKLDFRVNQANKLGLERCRDFSGHGLLPRECIGFFDWTQVGWDFLIDVDHIEKNLGQPVIDRWNATSDWLYDGLGLQETDVYNFKDMGLYNYRYYDSPRDTEPLEKFERRVELDELRNLESYRLLHVGTLFGTSRLRTVEEYNWEVRSAFRQAMVFHNTLLDKIADTIKNRLGGQSKYLSVHMRIGDGIFLTDAKKNVGLVFKQLLTRMKFPAELIEELLSLHSQSMGYDKPTSLHKRAALLQALPSSNTTFVKRASNSRPQRPGAYRHEWPDPIPPISKRAESPLHESLSCRGPLYTDKKSITLKLNAPLYLATDAAIPASDPVLSLFFKAFPCTFVLSDFMSAGPYNTKPVQELLEMEDWYNAEDQVPLAPFLYPIVDMMIAAKAYYICGTPQSTFSRFAVDVLTQSYHGWPVIERG